MKNIKYESLNYWVLKVNGGFEVYKIGIALSTRCAQIGYIGKEGLNKAIAFCTKREIELMKGNKKMKLDRKFKMSLTKNGEVIISKSTNFKLALPFWSVNTMSEANKLKTKLKVSIGEKKVQDVFNLTDKCMLLEEQKENEK